MEQEWPSIGMAKVQGINIFTGKTKRKIVKILHDYLYREGGDERQKERKKKRRRRKEY